jgi:hypothetical protein
VIDEQADDGQCGVGDVVGVRVGSGVVVDGGDVAQRLGIGDALISSSAKSQRNHCASIATKTRPSHVKLVPAGRRSTDGPDR